MKQNNKQILTSTIDIYILCVIKCCYLLAIKTFHTDVSTAIKKKPDPQSSYRFSKQISY